MIKIFLLLLILLFAFLLAQLLDGLVLKVHFRMLLFLLDLGLLATPVALTTLLTSEPALLISCSLRRELHAVKVAIGCATLVIG